MKCKCSCDLSRPEWAFMRLIHSHRMAHDAVFDRLELKVGQPILLFILEDLKRENRRCTQTELAELMHRSPSTITTSISSLEKRGYIHRTADDTDKRRNYVEITDGGIGVAQKCRRAFAHIDELMYSGFSPEEVENAISVFNRIRANLEALSLSEESEELKIAD